MSSVFVAVVPLPHATLVAFAGALRHKTQVVVNEYIHFIGNGKVVQAEQMKHSWVPQLLMHHRDAASPGPRVLSVWLRWGCKPAINHTHTLHSVILHWAGFSEAPDGKVKKSLQ